MNSAEGHPQTNVSFSATAPFVRAFGEKLAEEQQAKYNTPTSHMLRNPLLPNIPVIATPPSGSTATLPTETLDETQIAFALGIGVGVVISLIVIGIIWKTSN